MSHLRPEQVEIAACPVEMDQNAPISESRPKPARSKQAMAQAPLTGRIRPRSPPHSKTCQELLPRHATPKCSRSRVPHSSFIGADFGITLISLANCSDEWRQFNAAFIPVFLAGHPDKIAAGLACGALWTVGQRHRSGQHRVVPPMARATTLVGEARAATLRARPGVTPPPQRELAAHHHRPRRHERGAAQPTGSIGTVSNITDHHQEIEQFLRPCRARPHQHCGHRPGGGRPRGLRHGKAPGRFGENWAQKSSWRSISKIYEEDGELVGQQYATDAGPIDRVGRHKARMGKRLLVVELWARG